ncbi:MAG: glycosyltransferase [Acidiferrobacterales bacterium]|nr:glycosyltransferase [Acidiferrobacterales bacterium]
MAKVDLHLHSKYSDVASTWILKAYNAPESFTEPEEIYRQAKSRGMDLVTITDHDDIRGCLELVENHPDDSFISCEITSYFPEDNCKVHILVYGIDESQYTKMMELRRDLYKLRAYIARESIAYSVAHATYDQDGRLTFEHIEKLILLFDVFEVINGGSSERSNRLLHDYLRSLDDETLDELHAKHKIRPISSDPWIKGFTGGSDDHTGILIGTAYTSSIGNTPKEFLATLQNKATLANGLHGSFESYATGVIKHIHDYRKNRDDKYLNSKMNDFLELFFIGQEGNWIKRFKKSRSLSYLKRKNSRTHRALHNLLTQISGDIETDLADKIPSAYQQVAHLHDEMFRSVVMALTKKLPQGDIFKVFQHLSSIFPMMLLSSPFIGSMRHQVLKAPIRQKLLEDSKGVYTEKALWFTDTIDDLNGVSVTLRQIAEYSHKFGYRMKLVSCVDIDNLQSPLPANTINLTPVYQSAIPGYEQQVVSFPSLLTMMKKIIDEQPDQIIVSTPGPVGMGALFCAKLLDLPAKSIYHTDFAEQVLRMTDDTIAANWIDMAVNLFYKQFDEVYVPSNSYISKLKTCGLQEDRLSIFPRGIDLSVYHPANEEQTTKTSMLRRHQLHGEFTLVYAGRVSEDKNLSLLADIFELANRKNPGLYNLIVAGDGPFLNTLKTKLAQQNNVLFTGRIATKELVECYQSADLLVFPSHTDTFGMVVLEAQACGLPCLVSASGGPKEIISPNKTGEVIYSDIPEDWLAMIDKYSKLKRSQPQHYLRLKQACSSWVRSHNSWATVFEEVVGLECKLPDVDKDHKIVVLNQSSNSESKLTSPTLDKTA